MKRWLWFSFGILISFLLPCQALAHSPYFGQSEIIDRPDFGTVEFTVLYGDGIFFADPSQVVVFDHDGYLLAATPQSEAFLIRCNLSKDEPNCQIFDEVRGLVFEPNYEQWVRSRLIAQEGRPPRDAYPETMDIEYGFTQRPATFAEKILFVAVRILSTPIGTLLLVLWWCIAWSFVARLLWRWSRNGWRVSPISGWAVVIGVLHVMAFSGMSFLAVYSWLIQPYSAFFFSFAFLIGAAIAFIVSRSRQPRARPPEPDAAS